MKKIALSVCVFTAAAVSGMFAQVVATDDYETPFTAPDGASGDIAYGYNGGSGYGALTYVSGSPGGVFAANNASTGGRQLDGNQSLGIFSGGGSQTAGRTLNTSVTNGVYSVDARWDITNTANVFTGLNIASTLGTSLGDGELLSFGLVQGHNDQFQITDSTGVHLLSVGTDTELRGGIFNFSLAFDTVADTYSLTVTDKSNSQSGSISGALEGASPGAAAAIKFASLDTDGGTQNLIVDATTMTAVPEPSTVSLLTGPALLAGLFFVRRRRA